MRGGTGQHALASSLWNARHPVPPAHPHSQAHTHRQGLGTHTVLARAHTRCWHAHTHDAGTHTHTVLARTHTWAVSMPPTGPHAGTRATLPYSGLPSERLEQCFLLGGQHEGVLECVQVGVVVEV